MPDLIDAAKKSIETLLDESCRRAAEKGQLPAGAELSSNLL
mgnify:FL=1